MDFLEAAIPFPRRLRSACSVRAATTLLVTLACLGPTGCGPSKAEIRRARAMCGGRLELRPDYRETLGILEQYRTNDRYKNEFVLYGMCEVAVAVLGGDYSRADEVGKHAYLAVRKYQDADRERRAAMGNEAIKFFKGEPHERAMLCFYTGLTCYLHGEYNDARIFFTQSIFATATRDEDMANFRDDFRLGHFWLGRAYLALGQDDNARIAFSRAGKSLRLGGEESELKKRRSARAKVRKDELKGEALCFKNGSRGRKAVAGIADLSKGLSRGEMPAVLPGAAEENPTLVGTGDRSELLDREFQRQANLILIVESSLGPTKYLRGSSNSIDDYSRISTKEDAVDVYVDGHRSGPAFKLYDGYHQAMTRGVKTRRDRQAGKAVTKAILRRIPIVGIGAAYWDITADGRYWPSLPGQVYVYAARLKPGLHTLTLKYYDVNRQYLPRFDLSRHFINVPAEGDLVLLLRSLENHDNAYVLAHGTGD